MRLNRASGLDIYFVLAELEDPWSGILASPIDCGSCLYSTWRRLMVSHSNSLWNINSKIYCLENSTWCILIIFISSSSAPFRVTSLPCTPNLCSLNCWKGDPPGCQELSDWLTLVDPPLCCNSVVYDIFRLCKRQPLLKLCSDIRIINMCKSIRSKNIFIWGKNPH